MLALLSVDTKGAAEEKGEIKGRGGRAQRLLARGHAHNGCAYCPPPPPPKTVFSLVSSTTRFSTHKSVFQLILFQRCIDHFVFWFGTYSTLLVYCLSTEWVISGMCGMWKGLGGLEYRQEKSIAGHLDETYVVVMLLVVNILKEMWKGTDFPDGTDFPLWKRRRRGGKARWWPFIPDKGCGVWPWFLFLMMMMEHLVRMELKMSMWERWPEISQLKMESAQSFRLWQC